MEEDEPNESDTGENQQDQSVPARRAEGRAAETTGNASPFDSQRYQPRSLGSETSFQTHGVATPTLLVDPPPYSTELGDRLADSMAPFPQLETLSLINNLVSCNSLSGTGAHSDARCRVTFDLYLSL